MNRRQLQVMENKLGANANVRIRLSISKFRLKLTSLLKYDSNEPGSHFIPGKLEYFDCAHEHAQAYTDILAHTHTHTHTQTRVFPFLFHSHFLHLFLTHIHTFTVSLFPSLTHFFSSSSSPFSSSSLSLSYTT